MEMSLPERIIVNSKLFDIWRRWTARRLLKHAKRHKEILEIGCGKGTTTKIISENLPDAEITATDYDKAQVIRARKNLRKLKNVTETQADATKLKFKNESFDAIFAFLTFHHIGKWQKAQKECYRVLKSKGYLYIDELELKPFPRLQHFFFPTDGIFSRPEFVESLEKTGFKIILLRKRYKFIVIARKP